MSLLTAIVSQTKQKTARSMVGVLIGFKSADDGSDAMVVKEVIGHNQDGSVMTGDVYTITQGEIQNSELSAKRNTIATFKNPASKHHLIEGSIVGFERLKINQGNKTADATLIRDLVKNDKGEVRSVLIGLAKPLPVPKQSSSGAASVEIILPEYKKSSSILADFDRALFESIETARKQLAIHGIAESARAAIVITDEGNARPVSIIINSVSDINSQGDKTYRAPTHQEIIEQFNSNSTLKGVRNEIYKNPGKHVIHAMPAIRLVVPSSKAAEDNYSKRTINEYTGTFNVSDGDGGNIEKDGLGYRMSNISLWKGMVSSVTPITYDKPRLNDIASSIAIGNKEQKKSTSLAASRNAAEAKATDAATAFANAVSEIESPKQTSVNAEIDVRAKDQSAEKVDQIGAQQFSSFTEGEFDLGIFDEPEGIEQNSAEQEIYASYEEDEYFAQAGKSSGPSVI